MKHLVIALDRFVSEGLWEFCLGKVLNRYEDVVIQAMFARSIGYCPDIGAESDVLVVCENEGQAAKLGEILQRQLPAEQFGRVICLEGYEGRHYFDNCIRTKLPPEESLELLLDTIFKPSVVNLDYADFRMMAQGTENEMTGFYGEIETVKRQFEAYWGRVGAMGCMVNLYGDIDMSIASDIGAIAGACENFLFGAAYTEEGTGHIGLVVITSKEEL